MVHYEGHKESEDPFVNARLNLWNPTKGPVRMYINGVDIIKIIKLDLGFYNTGNISSASLDGNRISNTSAGRLLNHIRNTKIWMTSNKGSRKIHIYTTMHRSFVPLLRDAIKQWVTEEDWRMIERETGE